MDIILLRCVMIFATCVPQSKFKSLQLEHDELKSSYDALDTKSNEMKALIDKLNREKAALQLEANKIDSLNNRIGYLQRSLKEIEEFQSKTKNESQAEITALLAQLQREKEALQKKEDELSERNKKLMDLQAALDNKDKAVRDLRKKVADALLGFEGKGLTIEQKDGKVYVSMDEKLLFQSGKYDIEPAGATALKQLATVLEQNTDINIMVEGHTDSLKYRGSGNLQDNWDLSVKRATTVVRTLLQGSSISPIRVIAAGRGEFAPIGTNATPEGRQQNRRTEIILTPKMDELLKMIESN